MSAPSVQPRGLRRATAAAYLGISCSLFDRMRKEGRVPAPKKLFDVELYDRVELDQLFEGKALTPANDNAELDGADYWDRVCGIESRNT